MTFDNVLFLNDTLQAIQGQVNAINAIPDQAIANFLKVCDSDYASDIVALSNRYREVTRLLNAKHGYASTAGIRLSKKF